MLLRKAITRSVLLISLAAMAVAVWPGGIPTAGAGSGWLTVPGGLPLFDLAGIAPGDDGSATLTVTNPQSFPVKLSIAVAALANDDNGCNEPEQAIGDTTCGSGGGELQFDLLLAFTVAGSTDRLIGNGTVAEWAFQPAVDQVALGGHETRTYRVDYELPTRLVEHDSVRSCVVPVRDAPRSGPRLGGLRGTTGGHRGDALAAADRHRHVRHRDGRRFDHRHGRRLVQDEFAKEAIVMNVLRATMVAAVCALTTVGSHLCAIARCRAHRHSM